jgi:hypothetical protein
MMLRVAHRVVDQCLDFLGVLFTLRQDGAWARRLGGDIGLPIELRIVFRSALIG